MQQGEMDHRVGDPGATQAQEQQGAIPVSSLVPQGHADHTKIGGGGRVGSRVRNDCPRLLSCVYALLLPLQNLDARRRFVSSRI